MKEGEEQPKFRPNDNEFNERVRYVRESISSDPDAYETYTTEIPQYAKGEGDPETREQFYPGWIEEDFQILLNMLKKEGLIETDDNRPAPPSD